MEKEPGIFHDITISMLVILLFFYLAIIDIWHGYGWCRKFIKWLWNEIIHIRIDWVKLFKMIIAFAVTLFLIFHCG